MSAAPRCSPPARGAPCARAFQSLHDAPLLLPTENALRRALDAWFKARKITGEFEDSALLKVFGQDGLGVFPGPAVEAQIRAQYRSPGHRPAADGARALLGVASAAEAPRRGGCLEGRRRTCSIDEQLRTAPGAPNDGPLGAGDQPVVERAQPLDVTALRIAQQAAGW